MSVLSSCILTFIGDNIPSLSSSLNADVTGPGGATKGIVAVYDIFGYFDQTLQGADILATSDEHTKYKVFMPDYFKVDPCPIEW